MLFLLLSFVWANSAVQYIQIVDSASALVKRPDDPNIRHLQWPFCPTHNNKGCQKKRWVQLGIDIDAYMERRNNAHQSMQEIVDTSIQDVQIYILVRSNLKS